MKRYPQLIGGEWKESREKHIVTNPWNGEIVSEFGLASPEEWEEAILKADQIRSQFAKTSRYLRSQLLSKIIEILRVRKDEILSTILSESGKPITLCEAEWTRCLNTFQTAARVTNQFCGELYPMDLDPVGKGFYTAKTEFFPRGIIYAITPFNFPLNLVAHKVAPALAVGAPILLKPAPQAPGAGFLLGEIFLEAMTLTNQMFGSGEDRIPASAFQVLFSSNENAGIPVKDPRIAVISFTGSPSVGWKLQELGRKKKVLLELGGNAGVILAQDGDVDLCASRCAFGAVSFSGQSCISVQRIFAVEQMYESFRAKLVQEFEKQGYGDPGKKETVAGPVIDQKSKDRIQYWLDEAKSAGANLLTGGNWSGPLGNVLQPTLLEGVPPTCKLSDEEAFAPIAVLEKVSNVSEAISKVNLSRYGLHAGIFTTDIRIIQKAFQELEVGGVIVNEVPTFRADHMPYGGVKESGIGREGVYYAMEDFCERKTLVIRREDSV